MVIISISFDEKHTNILEILSSRYGTDGHAYVTEFTNEFYRLTGLDMLRYGVSAYRFTNPIQEFYELYDDANTAPFWTS